MPEYDFTCKKCFKKQTFRLGMNEERPARCSLAYQVVVNVKNGSKEDWDMETQVCGGPLVRIFSTPAIIYRAGGFQTTDKRLEPTEDELYD